MEEEEEEEEEIYRRRAAAAPPPPNSERMKMIGVVRGKKAGRQRQHVTNDSPKVEQTDTVSRQEAKKPSSSRKTAEGN